MHRGDWAWSAIAAGVIAYEASCPPGELLSEAVDRYRAARPIATHLAVGYLALHLLRRWPARADPLTVLATRWRR